MATITQAWCIKLRHRLHRYHMDLLLAPSPPLTKTQLLAALQSLEDNFEAAKVSWKADMETAMGQSISNNLAKKIAKFWMENKWERE